MVHSTHIKMLSPQRARGLTAAALLSAALVAGCGGSSASPTSAALAREDLGVERRSRRRDQRWVAHRDQRGRAELGLDGARRATGRGRSRSRGACALTACPTSQTHSPEAESSSKYLPEPIPPRLRSAAARAKCQNLLTDAGGAGSGPPPSDQTLAKLVRIARCMRQHGISDFPDPRTSAPASFPPGIAERDQFRRSGPAVPANAQHAGAGVQAGAGRVRRAATWPPTLIRTGVDASNATAAPRPSPARRTTPRLGRA